MYRTDLMEKAGLKMPEKPTWDFIKQAADKMTDKAAGVYGICLRGKPGWGENMAFLTAMSNSFGARWFDEKWKPQFNSPEWKKTMDFYVALMKADGPPGASSNGFNENLALFNDGKCGMWIDATVAAGLVTDPKESKVPTRSASRSRLTTVSARTPIGSGHGRSRCRPDRARPTRLQKFISWATSKHYTDLVASKDGWARVPPGTRTSLYKNADYLKAAPWARSDAGVDQLSRPAASDREAGPVYGRAVRGDPRVSGHRDGRRPGLLGGARRHDERRRRPSQGSGLDRDGDEEGRLYQVAKRAPRASRVFVKAPRRDDLPVPGPLLVRGEGVEGRVANS